MRLPAPRTVRWVFWPYAAVILALTHWPGVVIEGPIPRPDIVVHVAVFGVWTSLCIACAFFGERWRPRSIVISAAASLAYALLDEWTQSIPALRRVAAWDDAAANAAGVAAATITAFALAPRLRRADAARR